MDSEFPFNAQQATIQRYIAKKFTEFTERLEKLEAVKPSGGQPETPKAVSVAAGERGLGSQHLAALLAEFGFSPGKNKPQLMALEKHIATLGRVPTKAECLEKFEALPFGRYLKKEHYTQIWGVDAPEAEAWVHFLKKRMNLIDFQYGRGDVKKKLE